MNLRELVEELRNSSREIDRMATAHNIGDDKALSGLSAEIVEMVQAAIRDEYGDVLTLYHGSLSALDADVEWKENTSFTDEFDLGFAGEDGWVVEARVPVERITFYLDGENEFVISGGRLNCQVYTVAEYFGL